MTYNKDDIFIKAIEVIKSDNDIVFIEDLIIELGISKPTFYDYYPINSNEINEIKELILKNRANTKKFLRKKWKDSENATLNVCLYKLLSTEEERALLSDKVKEDNKRPTIGDNLANILGQITNAKD